MVGAVVPLMLGGHPVGALVVERTERHVFTPDERHFLRASAAQAALALSGTGLLWAQRRADEAPNPAGPELRPAESAGTMTRTDQDDLTVVPAPEGGRQGHDAASTHLSELETERAAMDAFVRYTERVGSDTDVRRLAQQALVVLRETCGVDAFYAERDGEQFRAMDWTVRFDPALLARLRLGFPLQHSAIAQVLQRNTAAFMNHWNRAPQWLGESEIFGAVAGYPFFLDGALESVLIMGSRSTRQWSRREQGIFRAIGRSLDLALERAEHAGKLLAQNQELAARTRVLEVFADLSLDLTPEGDVYLLIRRIQEVALSLLPPGVALYYEPHNGLWRVRTQIGQMHTPALQAMVDAGLPLAAAQSLTIPWTTRQPYYQAAYDLSSDNLGETGRGVGATASLPLLVGGQPRGVFVLGCFQATEWSPAHRVALETIVRSLGQALDRQIQARLLDEERASLDAFARFTVAAGQLTDAIALAEQASSVLSTMLDVTVGYSELEGGLWKGRVFSAGVPPATMEAARQGFAADLPSFRQPVQERRPVFVDGWDAQQEGAEATDAFGAAALYPYFQGTEPQGLLTMGALHTRQWSERERAIFLAVGRSLGLALERSHTAQELTQRSRQLEQINAEVRTANEELEAFGYSVSHDLQTPVRHMMGFAELAHRALLSSDVQKAGQHVEVIKGAAARMKALIDAMLKHSRTTRQVLERTPVDLNRLVDQARQDVAPDLLGRSVDWRLQRLPVVQGDAELLQQVVTNLLANAVKFTHRRIQTVIEVWAEEDEHVWTVTIRDNGVGFDAEYAERMFGVFQRLHTDRDFEGTGVGLSTVRRILIRHGGNIVAEGTRDHGATFRFWVPKVM